MGPLNEGPLSSFLPRWDPSSSLVQFFLWLEPVFSFAAAKSAQGADLTFIFGFRHFDWVSDLRGQNQSYNCCRLRKQTKRVMDPSLLKTKNLHEVKHWIEPGWSFSLYLIYQPQKYTQLKARKISTENHFMFFGIWRTGRSGNDAHFKLFLSPVSSN